MSSTPCSANRGPPTATRLSSGRSRRSAAATPAACKSPEASPATNSTLRMMVGESDQRRKSQLDLLNDLERNTQRQSPLSSRDDDGPVALEGADEALQLQLQRFAFRCVKLYP